MDGKMDGELAEKETKLRSIVREMDSVVIGYSGGVDSTLLLKIAVDELHERALAVIGRSETYPTSEYEEAVRLANSIGARFREVATEETDDLKFSENPPDRCYYCKTELFSKLKEIAAIEKIPWIADGTIVDDTADFRPGRRATEEQEVRSPLLEAGLSKADVRELSRILGLPTWDKPSFACLSSRFPYGFGITRENLTKVDRAESFLRSLGMRRYRVRHHDDKTARLELGPEEMERISDPSIRSAVVGQIKALGYTYVTLDLQGYRTGSMNEVLSIEIKESYLKNKT